MSEKTYKIIPLEWEKSKKGEKAITPLGIYEVWDNGKWDFFDKCGPSMQMVIQNKAGSTEKAKVEADANWKQRVGCMLKEVE